MIEIYIVSIEGFRPRHFSSQQAAIEYLESLGARHIGGDSWATYDEDGDLETEYTLEKQELAD